MPTLERITPANADAFRATRLRALRDSPTAFGSTWARESQLSDNDWLQRATDWSSLRATGYLAKCSGQRSQSVFATVTDIEHESKAAYCGIAAAFLQERDPRRAHLISMWVAPDHRRSGIGVVLIGAIRSWATHIGADTLFLTVTSNNQAAIDFYHRQGFSMTGRTEPYPNDKSLFEYEMSLAVAWNAV